MSTAARFSIGSSNNITPSNTISDIKRFIALEEASGDCPVERQRLIHKGRILNDDNKTLRDYGILDSNHTIHLVKSSANANRPSTGAAPVNRNQTNNAQTNNQNNNATSNNYNPFGSMMPPNMQDLMQNPEQISSMMNSPIMQSIMSNPDFLRSMMESNPQMRQLLDSNPELRHVLDDPELLRRSMEMMRDPSTHQNMMRNQDLAMSQIENIPGGFSALRRMYEDVQAPMMDAMANGNQSSQEGGTARSTANENSGAAGTAMPNPWARASNQPSQTTSRNTSANSNGAANPLNPFGMAANPWANMGTGSSGGNIGNNGMNIPGMPNMPNMNLEQTIEMLENPVMNQMMNSLMSNPETMQSILQSNPMLRQMTQANPQLGQMLNNPELMRTMMDPNNLRAMMQMQNAMPGIGGSGGSPFMGTGIPGGVPPPNAGSPPGLDFSTLLNQIQATSIGGSSAAGSSSSASVPPEQRYRAQLQALNDMGFDDNRVNIPALIQTHGNVNRAIDMLLTNPPAPMQAAVTPASPDADGDAENTVEGASKEDGKSND